MTREEALLTMTREEVLLRMTGGVRLRMAGGEECASGWQGGRSAPQDGRGGGVRLRMARGGWGAPQDGKGGRECASG